jgi:hypothetical protein
MGLQLRDCKNDGTSIASVTSSAKAREVVMDVDQWRNEGKHLPEFMRDFHDQKGLFKTIHEETGCEFPTWVQGHIYVVDVFLHYMARHGYTLQKTRTRVNDFRDIQKTVSDATNNRRNALASIFKRVNKHDTGRI